MHELSIVMSIVDIATSESAKHEASVVEAIELEIGELSGVEMQAFWFAWKQAVPNTCLSNAKAIINQPKGKAHCLVCEHEFLMTKYGEPCPHCQSHQVMVTGGREMRVKALTVT